MTKKMKKSLVITSLLATSFLTFGAISSLNTVETKASTADFTTTTGASVRISEPNGIRFRLELSTAKKNEIFAENSGKTLGMYIVRGNKIGEDYSTLSQKINLSFTEDDLYQIGNVWYANGVMTNLYVQNFNKEFVGVGYIATTVGETTTYEYTQVTVTDNARSMSEVAIEAYKDPKANVQDEMVSLLEKAVYADYGVVETRTMDGNTITGYSFTDGVTTWTSYANMQEELPIALSVSEKDLTLGETLDLNASLTVKDTKITGLDLPFAYSVDSDAVTLENGVLTAEKEGTANVTVSFGKYTKTVEINVTEKANVVFNPADVNSASQISYAQKAFGYDQNKVTQEFVSAEANLDTTYGGAYLRSIPTGVTGSGSYGRILLTPKFASNSYESYDLITIWILVESKTDDAVTVEFFNDANVTQSVTPNEWTQIKIARSLFMGKIDTAAYFNNIVYDNPTAICLGEIIAENYDESTNFVFDPTAADTTKISINQTATIEFKQASKSDYATTDYSGSYVSLGVNSNVNGQTSITPIHEVNAYQGYDAISVWVYVVTYASAPETLTIYLLNDAKLTQKITTGYWKQVMIPMSNFVAWNGNAYFCSIKYSSTIKKILIGEIKAVNYEDAIDENVVYNPATFDPSLITLTVNKPEYTIFNGVTPKFISADENTNTTYGGAYVKISAANLSATKQWGNIFLTPLHEISSYASYTSIKVWVYIETYNNKGATPGFCNTVYATLFGSGILADRTWTQLTIPIKTFTENTNYFFGANFANVDWCLSAVCIGEITAVK